MDGLAGYIAQPMRGEYSAELAQLIAEHAAKARAEGYVAGQAEMQERAAKAAHVFPKRAHTYASENADRYLAQEETSRMARDAVLALPLTAQEDV